MKKIIFVASGLVLMFLNGQAWAQNAVRDYLLDKHANYRPDDPTNRGHLYQLQTGHAGLFKYRDEDLSKMNSPYISWHCRPGSPPRAFADFFRDFDRKLTRFRDGAGVCAIDTHANDNPVFPTSEMAARENELTPANDPARQIARHPFPIEEGRVQGISMESADNHQPTLRARTFDPSLSEREREQVTRKTLKSPITETSQRWPDGLEEINTLQPAQQVRQQPLLDQPANQLQSTKPLDDANPARFEQLRIRRSRR